MDMFDELENINLLQEYQMNEVIIGTLLFTVFFIIYKNMLDEFNILEVLYMGIAFGLCYLTVLIFFNYISYFS
jgi:uncharacterized membrane protein